MNSMKKYLLIALVLFTPLTTFAAFDANLKYGAKGANVMELQEFLTAHEYYAGPLTGNFYSLTLAGVKRFQAANSVPATGYFGPLSRTAANRVMAIESGDSDADEIQQVGSISTPSNTDPIDALNQKVLDLTNKLEQQKTLQQQTNDTLNKIQENTKPVTQVMSTPEPVVNTEITIGVIAVEPNSALLHGEFFFDIAVVNSLGKKVSGSPVHMAFPADHDFGGPYSGDSLADKTMATSYIQFGPYVPTTPGTKTITFTSGNLTKSVTVEVK